MRIDDDSLESLIRDSFNDGLPNIGFGNPPDPNDPDSSDDEGGNGDIPNNNRIP